MKRVFAVLAVCAVFGAGYIAGSLNSFPNAQAQIGGGGAWPAAAVTPGTGGATQFYLVDTGTRTLVWCKSDGNKPSCLREPLP
ncbi:MAG TPA: hypothetical protein VGF27_13560 [Pseudoduganella sp.]|jgi:hypothetical protein